ncbi:hypothetical protein H9P43_004201 [Blastocladiella emersonii ATCC 22665]|nr:hypothetical protein H9P43_004201 [Blastocladiella emersonii ATCC 22665]
MDSHTCSICLKPLAYPRSPPCQHRFCAPCLATRHFGAPAPPLADTPGFDEAIAAALACAICRRPYAWRDLTDHPLPTSALSEHQADELRDRLDDADARAWRNCYSRVVQLAVGNSHTFVLESALVKRDNSHLWTVFVRCDDPHAESELIDHVVFDLGPSFNPSTECVRQPPFELMRLGSRPITIRCEIHMRETDPSLKSEPAVREWPLCLEGAGDFMDVYVPILEPLNGSTSPRSPGSPQVYAPVSEPPHFVFPHDSPPADDNDPSQRVRRVRLLTSGSVSSLCSLSSLSLFDDPPLDDSARRSLGELIDNVLAEESFRGHEQLAEEVAPAPDLSALSLGSDDGDGDEVGDGPTFEE